jgi:hypothetical protein
MTGSRGPKTLIAAAAVAALVASQLAAGAAASGLSPAAESEAGPGITITGIGFARTGPGPGAAGSIAVRRAVRNAGTRAAAVAAAIGVVVGSAEEVDLREPGQFADRRPSKITAAAATVRFAILGGATDAAGLREVKAYGSASARVNPAESDRSRPIKLAMLASRRRVTPLAARAARGNAAAAARAAGLALGPIVSIAEAPPLYYGYGSSFYDPALGQFGPGQFCGFFSRPVFRQDPRTGLPQVVRRVRSRRCAHQSTYSLHLEIAYLAATG